MRKNSVKNHRLNAQVQRGVQDALEIAREEKIDLAILKSRSPTCGVHQIYDGTFSHHLIDGEGAFAKALRENGFRVLDVEDLEKSEFSS